MLNYFENKQATVFGIVFEDDLEVRNVKGLEHVAKLHYETTVGHNQNVSKDVCWNRLLGFLLLRLVVLTKISRNHLLLEEGPASLHHVFPAFAFRS